MRELISLAAIAFGLYGLWYIGRSDLARFGANIRRVQAEVYGHHKDTEGGFLTQYRFSDERGEHRVRALFNSASASPTIGTIVELTYPEGKPELARPKETVARPFLYSVLFVFVLIGGFGLLV